jgi:cell wall-associated NlpC family hydrolase
MQPFFSVFAALCLFPLWNGQTPPVPTGALAALMPADPGDGLLHTGTSFTKLPGQSVEGDKPKAPAFMGWLAQAKTRAPLRLEPDSSEKVVYTVPAKRYLVVRPWSDKSWYSVLLNNGQYGFMPASTVTELPFTVERSGKGVPPMGSHGGDAVTSFAVALIDAPYKAGGADPQTGIGNAALIQKAFERVGIKAPANADRQVMYGKAILRLEDLKAGDVLFFWRKTEGSSYEVAIFVGGDHCVLSDPKAEKVHLMRLEPRALKRLYAALRYGV